MNKALIVRNSLELRKKLYKDYHIIGFDTFHEPEETKDCLDYLVLSDPEETDFIDPPLMYHTADERVLKLFSPDSYIFCNTDEEFLSLTNKYYKS